MASSAVEGGGGVGAYFLDQWHGSAARNLRVNKAISLRLYSSSLDTSPHGVGGGGRYGAVGCPPRARGGIGRRTRFRSERRKAWGRSEEHTSELQSPVH